MLNICFKTGKGEGLKYLNQAGGGGGKKKKKKKKL